MKRINVVTAIANPILNEELKKYENINICTQDIQYQEGILEVLELNNQINIDFIILSQILPGELPLEEIIDKIKIINKEINIIIILENKNEKIENILNSKGIFKIIYNNQIKTDEIVKLMSEEKLSDSNLELKKEIEILRKVILEKNNNIENNKTIIYEKYFKYIINKIKEKININKKTNKNKEIISISGTSGVGKSIISVNLAKALAYENNKVLIIDFDILNNSLHTILGVKKYPQKINENKNEINLNNFIIKVNKRIDLISATEILFDSNNKLNILQFKQELDKFKKIYNTIIIDTSSECFFDYTKSIIKMSNKNIFVVEANILEIKKARNLLNIYINNWDIEKNKFNILFNKYNKDAINFNLLKKLFDEFNIIGTIRYNAKYNRLINKNVKNNFIDKNIREDYFNIKTNI